MADAATRITVPKGRAWKWDDAVYGVSFRLYCCPHATMVKSLKRQGVSLNDTEEPPLGKVIEHFSNQSRSDYTIWIAPGFRPGSLEDLNTLVHEVMHVVMTALMRRGVNADRDHEEPYCYYAGWLFAECLRRLRERR